MKCHNVPLAPTQGNAATWSMAVSKHVAQLLNTRRVLFLIGFLAVKLSSLSIK